MIERFYNRFFEKSVMCFILSSGILFVRLNLFPFLFFSLLLYESHVIVNTTRSCFLMMYMACSLPGSFQVSCLGNSHVSFFLFIALEANDAQLFSWKGVRNFCR